MTAINSLARVIEGNWDQIKGKIKGHWGKLTDDDIEKISGSYDQLAGKLEEIYGYTKDDVEKKLSSLSEKLNLQEMKGAMGEVQEKVTESLSKLVETIKSKADELQEGFYCYVKVNPARSIGAAVLLSLFMMKLLRHK